MLEAAAGGVGSSAAAAPRRRLQSASSSRRGASQARAATVRPPVAPAGRSRGRNVERPARLVPAAAVESSSAPSEQQAPGSSSLNGAPPPLAQQQQQHASLQAQPSSSSNGTAAAANSSEARPASTDALMRSQELEAVDGVQMAPQRLVASGLFVRVRDMVKHFSTAKGIFKAVDGVDVDIEPSSICALLGPSGSGKTTLLRLVAGLEQPTGGKIFFDDLDATDLPVQDRQVGMVFQSYALFNHMSVADNIKFGLQVRKLAVDHDKRAADLLELVQLTGLGDRYPRQLSGGQRQRVALARALASNPRLLLLDEPFGALDAVVRKQLRAGLKEIVRSVGVTTIIVTHDQEEAFDLADKVVIFNRGLIEQSGAPTEIIRHPATPFVMNFVGDTNSVPATCLLVRRSGFNARRKARVMFRPSDIQLYKAYVESVDGHLVTPATVSDKANMGWSVKYALRFDDDVEVDYSVSRAQADGELRLDVGQRIYVFVKPTAMMAFDDAEVDSAPLV